MRNVNIMLIFIVLIFSIFPTTQVLATNFKTKYFYPDSYEFTDPPDDTMKFTLDEYTSDTAAHTGNYESRPKIDVRKLSYNYDIETGIFEIGVKFTNTPSLSDFIYCSITFTFVLNSTTDLFIFHYKSALPDDLNEKTSVSLVNEPLDHDQRVVVDYDVINELDIDGNWYKVEFNLNSLIKDDIDLSTLFYPSLERFWRPGDYNHPNYYINIEDRFDFVKFGWYSYYEDELYGNEDNNLTIGRFFSIYWPVLLIIVVILIVYRYRNKIKGLFRKEKELVEE